MNHYIQTDKFVRGEKQMFLKIYFLFPHDNEVSLSARIRFLFLTQMVSRHGSWVAKGPLSQEKGDSVVVQISFHMSLSTAGLGETLTKNSTV